MGSQLRFVPMLMLFAFGCCSAEPFSITSWTPDAPLIDAPIRTDAGFVLTSEWEAELQPSTGMRDFGWSVALARDASRVLVGAPTSGWDYGRVFLRDGTSWSEEASLTPAVDLSEAGPGFSVALSSDGTRALVGTHAEDRWGDTFGSARVFVRADRTWSEEAMLVPPDAVLGTGVGMSVALADDGDVALVGAPLADATGLVDGGVARVFVRTGTEWSEQATLAASSTGRDRHFGWSVALSADGGVALVGAPGGIESTSAPGASAWVFARVGTTWTEETELTPARGTSPGFGRSVALSADGSLAVVGSPHDRLAGYLTGSASVFVRTATGWTEEATLLATDWVANDELGDLFGSSVALSSDARVVLVGAPRGDAGRFDAGSTHVFVRNGSVWAEQIPLTAPYEIRAGAFGCSVALSAAGTQALVGACPDEWTMRSWGTAHSFRLEPLSL